MYSLNQHTCLHGYIFASLHKRMHKCKHVCTHMHMRLCAPVYMGTFLWMQAYMHVCMHACMNIPICFWFCDHFFHLSSNRCYYLSPCFVPNQTLVINNQSSFFITHEKMHVIIKDSNESSWHAVVFLQWHRRDSFAIFAVVYSHRQGRMLCLLDAPALGSGHTTPRARISFEVQSSMKSCLRHVYMFKDVDCLPTFLPAGITLYCNVLLLAKVINQNDLYNYHFPIQLQCGNKHFFIVLWSSLRALRTVFMCLQIQSKLKTQQTRNTTEIEHMYYFSVRFRQVSFYFDWRDWLLLACSTAFCPRATSK